MWIGTSQVSRHRLKKTPRNCYERLSAPSRMRCRKAVTHDRRLKVESTHSRVGNVRRTHGGPSAAGHGPISTFAKAVIGRDDARDCGRG
jgi:hypothetical protein